MDKTIARLTIERASEMTPEGRADISRWLRRQAAMLLREGDNYSERFTAKFLVPNEDSSKKRPNSRAR